MNPSPGPAPSRRRGHMVAVAVVLAVVVLVVAGVAARALLTRPDGAGRAAPTRLTLLADPATTALAELAGNRLRARGGAVVAVDPATGAVLVAVSTPDTGSGTPQALGDRTRALANAAFARQSPPYQAFHVIVAATALAAGRTPETRMPAGEQYTPPGQDFSIRNPGAGCAAQVTLQQALVQSCHTAFARFCVEQGAPALAATARAFGFDGSAVRFTDGSDLSAAAAATGPLESIDPVALAQTCAGSREVRMTPLLGALAAGAAVNGGRLLRPHVAQDAGTDELARPLTGPAADQLRAMMVASATTGNAKNAQISGVEVGGKAGGSAEQDGDGWFIGFAVRDGRPVVAIAVLLEGAGTGGGAEAARVGGQVMRSVVRVR